MDLREHLQSALGQTYAIERELGGGGMSRVFVATEQSLGRQVVVKVLPSETGGALSMERFRREIRLAASLQQANIVPVLSAGDADGVAYYTMPFVRGESLRSQLSAKGVLSVGECVAIVRDVARALAFAHGEGVVHRDIKPENILLSGGTAVVTDFGIAKAVAASSTQAGSTALTQMGLVLGTPEYMAPEQAVGDEVDHRSDIYALGIVAYEMLAGRTPFAGRSAQAMLVAHAMEAPPLLGDKRRDAPPGLVALVMRCLAKEKADRPQSAAAVLVALDTLTTPQAITPAKPLAPATPCVAVLPLANLGPSADDEYFSDGITEDIIVQLSQIKSLKVIARTSVMRYKRTEKSVKEIASELGVSHIATGSVRRAGPRLRIVAQLVDAHSEEQLWARTFDRDLHDVFAIQSEVAEETARALAATLTTDERARINRPPTANIEAYDLFQLGRFHTEKWTADGWQKGVELLQQAIRLDPRYAAPHATLAMNYAIRAYLSVLPSKDAFQLAESEARVALTLDGLDADAHLALAYVEYFLYWNWEAAGREMQTALALSPGNAHARTMYGTLLGTLGRLEEGMVERTAALELSPLDTFISFNVGFGYLLGRKFDDATRLFRRALELEPRNGGAVYGLGITQIAAGDPAAASATFEAAIRRGDTSIAVKAFLAWAYGVGGRRLEAERLLDELLGAASTEYVSPYHVALVHSALGHTNEFFEWIERAYAERSMWLVWFHVTPTFDTLRRDPRFDSIVRRMGLPPEAGLA